MFRLADRIAVLRHGRVVAEVRAVEVHPDDVVALMSGQQVDSSARRQLTRLHGLADRLVSADPSSSLSLILSALGAALGSERLCIHLLERPDSLVCAASLGLPAAAAGRVVAAAAAARRAARSGWPPPASAAVIEETTCGPARPGRRSRELARAAKVGSSWSVPVLGPGRAARRHHRVPRHVTGRPQRDELDLVTAVRRLRGERDRAGPAARRGHRAQPGAGDDPGDAGDAGRAASRWPTGSAVALQALRRGLQADEVALLTGQPDGPPRCRALGRRATGAAAEPARAGCSAPRPGRSLGRASRDDVAASRGRTDGDRRLR